MKSKIRKSVIPYGAIVAAVLFCFVLVFSLVVSKATYAGDGKPKQSGRMLAVHDRGTERVIITEESSVGEALKRAGIAIDPKDVVEPAVNEKLIASDYQVNIYRARPVLIVDGGTRTKVTTAYQTANQIIASAGIKLYEEDITTLGQTSDLIADGVGLQVVIDRAMAVNLTLYGRVAETRTQAGSIAELLREKNIKLETSDKVLPDKNTKLSEGMHIRVWREGKQIISVDEPVDFSVETIEDADRPAGYRDVKIAGEAGLRSVSYEIIIQDETEVSRSEIASIIIKQPKTQTETIGAKGKYSTPSENENITWDYLLSQGFSRTQTAGIMGNLMQEHGFKTTDVGGGLGIAQWIGGRRQRLLARQDPENIYVQLDFLMSELNGSYAYVRDGIKATSSLNTAVEIFQNQFERCNPVYCNYNRRVMYAQNILASHP